MLSCEWREDAGTAAIEVSSGSSGIGRVRLMGASGAIAETPLGSFSFRSGGVDPGKRSWWKRRLSHDADVVDLASQKVVASFSVGPLHRTLRLSDEEKYEWQLSFLANRGMWKRGDTVVCQIVPGSAWVDSGSERADAVLLFFGLYLVAPFSPRGSSRIRSRRA
jgi:hypothetical protein